MKRNIYFLFIILLTAEISPAQNKIIDSLKTVLKTEKEDTSKVNSLNILSSNLNSIGNYSVADSCAQQALALSEKINFKTGIANGLINTGFSSIAKGLYATAMQDASKALHIYQQTNNVNGIGDAFKVFGNIYYNQGNYQKAIEYENNALKLYRQTKNLSRELSVLMDIGVDYSSQGDYQKGLEYQLQSLSLAKKINDSVNIAANMGNIGLIYYNQGNYSDALKYEFEALDIDKKNGDKDGISINLGNIGNVYDSEGKAQLALKYYLESLSIQQKLGHKNALCINLLDISDVLIDLGDSAKEIFRKDSLYKSALDYSIQALDVGREFTNKFGIANTYETIGSIYFRKKNYSVAKTYLDSALSLSKSIGAKDAISASYQDFCQIDSVTGNFEKALSDYKNYIIYRDSLINDANTKKMVQAQMTFDFQQKEAVQQALQDQKNRVEKQERKKQLIIRNIFIGGFLLMLLLAFFIFRGLRDKQKANVLLEEKNGIIEQQKLSVEEKNREITSSINYALRIQKSILPSSNSIKESLLESFIYYKPKDIVAGDFYWMENVGNKILIAACDCTGHGVPGAMVSVVCYNALNRAVREFGLTQPSAILDKTAQIVIENFAKSEEEIKDGMDISLCSIEKTKDGIHLQWSGANCPLWIFKNGGLLTTKADKQAIGYGINNHPFTNHTFELQKNDTLYLFSDGYADQFGGENGKKMTTKRFKDLLISVQNLSLQEQGKALDKYIINYRKKTEQTDDVLVIGIKV